MLVLFSREFLDAVPLIRVLALGVIVRCAYKVVVPYLAGTDRPGMASLAVGIGTTVNLVLLLVLLPTVGLTGAAIAMTVGYLVSSFILGLSFRPYSGIGFRQTWRFARADRQMVSGALGRLKGKARGAETGQ